MINFDYEKFLSKHNMEFDDFLNEFDVLNSDIMQDDELKMIADNLIKFGVKTYFFEDGQTLYFFFTKLFYNDQHLFFYDGVDY